MKMSGIPGLVICVVICMMAGVIGSIFTTSSVTGWYTTIQKPSFNPPGWIFGPVWTTLYILMGIALWLVLRSGADASLVRPAVWVFAFQLALNAGWSIVFFGLHSPGWAFAVLAALWLLILASILLFWRISTAAGALLLPYIAWVSFAGVLNWAIWRLNG